MRGSYGDLVGGKQGATVLGGWDLQEGVDVDKDIDFELGRAGYLQTRKHPGGLNIRRTAKILDWQ